MKKIIALVSALFAANVLAYQVTGPVLEVSDTKIVVQKGKEKWEIKKDPSLKTDVKVGDKVTIEYVMNATKVEIKKK